MGAARTRSIGVWSSARWIVVAGVALVAVACAQIPGDAGSVSTTSISTTSTDVVTTTAQVTSSTFTPPSTTSTVAEQTTTSTVAEQTVGAPPKPEGEPDIELLPVLEPGDIVYDPTTGAEAPDAYFVFGDVSGYESFTVTSELTIRFDDRSASETTEGKVDGSVFYYSGTGDASELINVGDPIEVITVVDSRELKSWSRVDGEWTSAGVDPLGVILLTLILPDVMQSTLYDTFATMEFVDWDLIDGFWYARYGASPEFVAGILDYGEDIEDLVALQGDVWVSPRGFMHSFEISVADGEGFSAESAWRLSDLGTTSIDVPNT